MNVSITVPTHYLLLLVEIIEKEIKNYFYLNLQINV